MQARMPGIGVKSVAFGNATFRGSPGLLNRGSSVKAGWARNPATGMIGFRYRLPMHVWMGNTNRIAVKFPGYNQIKKIKVRR